VAADLLNRRVIPFCETHEIRYCACLPMEGPLTVAIGGIMNTSCTSRWRTTTAERE
jgi:hypothetical protein